MKKFIFDLETTGLSDKKNGIIQIAGIIDLGNDQRHKFDFKCKPYPGKIIEPQALAVTGTTQEMIDGYADPKKAYKALVTLMGKYIDKFDKNDKFVIMGYNCIFDIGFMRQFFIDSGDRYYGSWFSSYNMIDVHKLFTALRGSGLYPELEEVENMKLETLANFYGIEIKAHDALSDIYATEELYRIFLEQLSRHPSALKV